MNNPVFRQILELDVYVFLLYVSVTVHRDKLRMKLPTRCIKYP